MGAAVSAAAGALDVVLLTMVYVLRLAAGAFMAQGTARCRRPEQTLTLVDWEADPDCRRVRETLCVLDIDVVVKPCPHRGTRFRHELDGGGRPPFLLDPNSGQRIAGGEAIIKHLWRQYGNEATPPMNYRLIRTGPLDKATGALASAIRFRDREGRCKVESSVPDEPLVLWGSEGSPFVARVREALCVLELPYVYRTAPKFNSVKRKEYKRRFGNMLSLARKNSGLIQIPLLEDPNTGEVLLESADIIEYLFRVYES
ncbi:GST N-terminal domain-containing protein [Durusdinium trenchii]|uniref:GST N-terminal domain-containing protein n=1 Tax=Durusdinium trenchii TaxID=1381693 RepID=A0ABP0IG28_9DINO